MSLLQQFSGSSTPIDFDRRRRLLDLHKRSIDPHSIILIAQMPQIIGRSVPADSEFMKLFSGYLKKANDQLYQRIRNGENWGGVVPVRETSDSFRQFFYGLAPEEQLTERQYDDKHPVCFLQDYLTALRGSAYFSRDIVRAYEDLALRRGENAIVENFWEGVRDDLSDFRRLFPNAPKPPSDDDDPRPRTPLRLSLPSLPFGRAVPVI